MQTGFGVALEQCFDFIEQFDESSSVEIQSERAMHLLSSYIDSWENYQAQDDEESELVDLFDATLSPDTGSSVSSYFPNATDSMTAFIGKCYFIVHRSIRYMFLISQFFRNIVIRKKSDKRN